MAEQILKNRLTRVAIKNFRSIAECDVALEPLTILVGPNGSGKSNFVGALRFLRDCLVGNVAMARAAWWRIGGAERSVNERKLAYPQVCVEGTIGESTRFAYGFRLAEGSLLGATVEWESCRILDQQGTEISTYERTVERITRNGAANDVAIPKDGLLLKNLSGVPPFSDVYAILSRIWMLSPQPVLLGSGNGNRSDVLDEDCKNLAEFLFVMQGRDEDRYSRMREFLTAAVPEISQLTARQPAGLSALAGLGEFNVFATERDESGGVVRESHFDSLSGGARTVIAVLTAVLLSDLSSYPPSIVILEEPENGVHPAVAGVIWDALNEGATHAQIIATTHSPDLLDRKDIPEQSILAVEKINGSSVVAPLSDHNIRTIRDRLMTPGELMRIGHLGPRRPVPVTTCD